MSFPVSQTLTYVLPPVLGAVIGYVTNALAIKMLFRPLTEKRIFGIRLPFTPGIIPKKRYDLAHSIGTMVSRELITESIIQERLGKQDFEHSINSQVEQFTASLLAAPAGTLIQSGGGNDGAGIRQLLSSVFKGITESDAFKSLVTELIRDVLTDLAAKPLSAIVGSPDSARDGVQRVLNRFLSEKNITSLRKAVSGADLLKMPHITGDVQAAVYRAAYALYPLLLQSLVQWLEQEETRKTLEVQGRKLVKSIVDRLSGLQRLFVTAGKFDKKIEDNLPLIVGDIIESVKKTGREEVTRKNLSSAISGGLFQSEAGNADRSSSFSRAGSVLLDEGANLLGNPALQTRITEMIVQYLEKKEAASLKSLLAGILNKPEEILVHDAAESLVSALFSSKAVGSETIGDLFRRVLLPYKDLTIGEIIGITEQRKKQFDAFAAGKIIDLLREKIPRLVESFNIYQLVVDRINSLNIESVEKLLLIVIEKHLKWINIFGGILGALIGTAQVVLRIFF